jgi:hypothetical protein
MWKDKKNPTYKTFIVWRLLLKLIRHGFDPDEWWWRKIYAELITCDPKSCLISFNSSLQTINVLYVVFFLSFHVWLILHTFYVIIIHLGQSHVVWRLLLKLIRHDFDPDEWWWRKMYAELMTPESIKKNPTYKTFIVWSNTSRIWLFGYVTSSYVHVWLLSSCWLIGFIISKVSFELDWNFFDQWVTEGSNEMIKWSRDSYFRAIMDSSFIT